LKDTDVLPVKSTMTSVTPRFHYEDAVRLQHQHCSAQQHPPIIIIIIVIIIIMNPTPKTHFSTLLKYTYRANIVFFAGFTAWYVMKGQQGQKPPPLKKEGNEGND
jgi:hypothetical protein